MEKEKPTGMGATFRIANADEAFDPVVIACEHCGHPEARPMADGPGHTKRCELCGGTIGLPYVSARFNLTPEGLAAAQAILEELGQHETEH